MASSKIARPKLSNIYLGDVQTITGIDMSLAEGIHRMTVSVSPPAIAGYTFRQWLISSSGTYRYCGLKIDGDNFFYFINSSYSGTANLSVYPIYEEA